MEQLKMVELSAPRLRWSGITRPNTLIKIGNKTRWTNEPLCRVSRDFAYLTIMISIAILSLHVTRVLGK